MLTSTDQNKTSVQGILVTTLNNQTPKYSAGDIKSFKQAAELQLD